MALAGRVRVNQWRKQRFILCDRKSQGHYIHNLGAYLPTQIAKSESNSNSLIKLIYGKFDLLVKAENSLKCER